MHGLQESHCFNVTRDATRQTMLIISCLRCGQSVGALSSAMVSVRLHLALVDVVKDGDEFQHAS